MKLKIDWRSGFADFSTSFSFLSSSTFWECRGPLDWGAWERGVTVAGITLLAPQSPWPGAGSEKVSWGQTWSHELPPFCAWGQLSGSLDASLKADRWAHRYSVMLLSPSFSWQIFQGYDTKSGEEWGGQNAIECSQGKKVKNIRTYPLQPLYCVQSACFLSPAQVRFEHNFWLGTWVTCDTVGSPCTFLCSYLALNLPAVFLK